MIIEFLKQPWSWYFSGIMIAGIMLLLLYFGKSFGFSSNLRTLCSILGAGRRVSFFKTDWKTQKWNLLFLAGSIIGGWIASTFLQPDAPLQLSGATIRDLSALGITFDGKLLPEALFGIQSFTNLKLLLILIGGGFLVGFGARYAGGCTSGHAISGLSGLQLPSLIAVAGFFAGGLLMTHLLMKFIV